MNKRRRIIIFVLLIVFSFLFVSVNKDVFNSLKNKLQKGTTSLMSISQTNEVNIIINDMNSLTNLPLSGNRIKISLEEDNANLDIYDAKTEDAVVRDDDGSFVMPLDGIRVKLSDISKNNSYFLNIEMIETIEKYNFMFKKAVLNIDYKENNAIEGSIFKIIGLDEEGNEIEIENDNYVLFMYDSQGKIIIRNNDDYELYYLFSNLELSEDDLNNSNWLKYDKSNGLVIEHNGVVYGKSRYKDGLYSDISEIKITNIDKLEPQINIINVVENENHDEAIVNIDIDDSSETLYYAKSGLYGYQITSTDQEPEEWIEFSGGNIELNIDENGIHYLWAKDNVGNLTMQELNINIISFEPKNYAAVILDCPIVSLVGKTYKSLSLLMEDLEENGLTSESELTLIQVLDEIKSDSVLIDNKNIKIDLNGQVVASREKNPVLSIKNSSNVTIVDNKYNISNYLDSTLANEIKRLHPSSSKEGTLKNNYNSVIYIDSESVLNMGEDNSPNIANIEFPNQEAPLILSNTTAIISEGTFNFYDGRVIASVPIEGRVFDTPPLFDPTITYQENDENYFMILQRVTEIEALIGKSRFVSLESAIDYANNVYKDSSSQVKIDLVVSIVRTQPIIVDDTKNIKIDLNGNRINSTSTSGVFVNSGKLVFVDSTNGSGNIYCKTGDIIKNNPDAYLEINKIKLTQEGAYAIVRNVGGEVKVNSGTLSNNNSSSYGIYNNDNIVQTSTVSISLDSVESSSSYYFEKDNNGYLVNNNQAVSDSLADSYIPIDLLSYDSTKKYYLQIEYMTSIINELNEGYIYLSESSSVPNYDTINNNIYKIGGNKQETIDLSNVLKAGKKYYLHFGFKKSMLSGITPEYLKIMNIKLLVNKSSYGKLTISGGTISGTSSYNVYNNSQKTKQVTINSGSISSLYHKYSSTEMVMNGGTVSNLYNYGTLNKNGGTITTFYNYLKANQTSGSITNLYNYNTTSVMELSGGSVSTFYNNNGKANIKAGSIGTLNLSTSSTTTNQNACGYITGGTITTLNNYSLCIHTLKDFIITNTFTNSVTTTLTLDNVTFNKTEATTANYIFNNTNNNSTINFNNSLININVIKDSSHNRDYKAIYSNGGATINLNNSNIKFNTNIKYNSSNTNMYGIYILDTSSVNLNKSNIEIKQTINVSDSYSNYAEGIISDSTGNIKISDDSTVMVGHYGTIAKASSNAIYNKHMGNIYLGSKDGNYKKNSLIVKGPNAAIYNCYGKVYFYDGSMYGNNMIGSTIEDIEDNYYLKMDNVYDEFLGTNIRKLTLVPDEQDNILNVDTNETFNYLGDAISSCGITNCNLKVLSDWHYEVAGYNNVIEDNQNINLDLNGKLILLGSGLNNKGYLNINSGSLGGIRTRTVNNRGNFDINNVNFLYELPSNSVNGMMNYSNLNIENSKQYPTAGGKFNQIIINNGGELNLKDNSLVTTEAYVNCRAIYNTGTLNFISGTIEMKSNNANTIGIYNNGGIVEITNGKINSSAEPVIMNNYSNVDPSNLVNYYNTSDSNYMFRNSNGMLISSNTSKAYIKMDLSSYDNTEEFDFSIKAHASESNKTFKVCITESTSEPTSTETCLYNAVLSTSLYEIKSTLLGGKVLYLHLIAPNGKIDIQDINLESESNKVKLFRKAKVTINGGTITSSGKSSTKITNYNTDFVINGGTISGGTTAVVNNNFTNFVMNGGVITSVNTGVQSNNSVSNITINNGTISNNIQAIINNANELIINGGTISSSSVAVTNSKIFRLNGGAITSSAKGVDNTGTMYFDNGSITASSIGINNGGPIYITGGTISASSYGINTTGNYAFEMRGGTINSSNHGIYASGVTLKIYDANITSTGADGINFYNSSTLILGENDGDVSITKPMIAGKSYGINNNLGTFRFYDGILKGQAKEFYGNLTEKVKKYELIYGTEGNYKTVHLGKINLVENIDTGVPYDDFTLAIDECSSSVTCNLRLLYSFVLDDNIVMDKDIVLDFNNYTIITSNINYFTNKGKLVLKNGNIEASTGGHSESIIVNRGDLVLDNNVQIKGLTYNLIAITNYGNITFNSGEISIGGSDNTNYGIINYGGKVEFNGGVLNSTTAAPILFYNYPTINSSLFHYYTDLNSTATYSFTEGILNNTTALKTYIELDLLDYDSESFNVAFKGYASGDNKSLKLCITTSPNEPGSGDSCLYNSYLPKTITEISSTIEGGLKYYLHIITPAEGIFIQDISVSSENHELVIYKHPKLILNTGTIKSTGTTNTKIQNQNGYIEVNGGSISGGNTTIANTNYSLININGGTISSSSYAIDLSNYSTLNLYSGSISGKYRGIALTSSYLNMYGGTVSISGASSGSGLAVSSSSIANIYNGTIRANDGSAITSVRSETNIYDGVIIAKKDGISVSTNSNVKMEKGSVTASDIGIFFVSGKSGTFTLGKNDGTVNIDSPVISGTNYAVDNRFGTFNFYDGILRGNTPVYGDVTNRPVDYNLYYDPAENNKALYLKSTYVVENTDTSIQYKTLSTAINACIDNTKCNLKMLNHYELPYSLNISSNKDIYLNLNKFQIRTFYQKYIINNGTFEMADGSIIAKSGKDNNAMISNYGHLILSNQTTVSSKEFVYLFDIANYTNAILDVNNSTITNGSPLNYKNSSNLNGFLIYNSGGVVNLNNSTVQNSPYMTGTLITIVNGELNITNSTVYNVGSYYNGGTTYGTWYKPTAIKLSNSHLKINGSIINTSGSSGYAKPLGIDATGSEIIVNNSQIKNSEKPFNLSSSSTLKSENSTISGDTNYASYGIWAASSSNITIIGGSVSGKSYGLYANSSTVSLQNANITGTDSIGLFNVSSNTTINGGTIKSNKVGINSSNGKVNLISGSVIGSTNGIEMSGSAVLTIGENDGVVSTTSPSISGNTYGINKSGGTIKFYDGIIKGNSMEYTGKIDEIPNNYNIYIYNHSATLRLIPDNDNTLEYNGIYFSSFEDIMEQIVNSTSKQGVIRLWSSISSNRTLTIPEGVKITLSLEGNILNYEDVDVGIINNGELIIVDSIDPQEEAYESMIINEDGITVDNHGSLILGQDNNLNDKSPIIKGRTAVSDNEPTILSGLVVSTDEGNLLSNLLSDILEKILFKNLYRNERVNYINSNVKSSSKPIIYSDDDLIQYRKDNVKVLMNADIYPTLNIYEGVDVQANKFLHYTIEGYFDGSKQFSELFTVNVDFESSDTIDSSLIQLKQFTDKYKEYEVDKIVINSKQYETLPDYINDNDIVKIYFKEIVVDNNPDTGNKLFYVYILGLIISIVLLYLSRNRKKKDEEIC